MRFGVPLALGVALGGALHPAIGHRRGVGHAAGRGDPKSLAPVGHVAVGLAGALRLVTPQLASWDWPTEMPSLAETPPWALSPRETPPLMLVLPERL
jgi:hypothetical protein